MKSSYKGWTVEATAYPVSGRFEARGIASRPRRLPKTRAATPTLSVA